MPTGSDVITAGRKYLGVPYKSNTCATYGVTSRMDCDQFTWQTYKDLGTRLGCWTNQMNDGREVSLSNLMPGDLLFFSEDGSGRLTHVGINSYNGYLLHASSYYGKVVESERRYVKGLFMARRVF